MYALPAIFHPLHIMQLQFIDAIFARQLADESFCRADRLMRRIVQTMPGISAAPAIFVREQITRAVIGYDGFRISGVDMPIGDALRKSQQRRCQTMSAQMSRLPNAVFASMRHQLLINWRAINRAAGVVPAIGADGV